MSSKRTHYSLDATRRRDCHSEVISVECHFRQSEAATFLYSGSTGSGTGRPESSVAIAASSRVPTLWVDAKGSGEPGK